MIAAEAHPTAHKGRSASFCVAGQLPRALATAHSSSDLREGGLHAQLALMQAASTPARLKAAHAARRSQSCRVQGSRPPRAARRLESPSGSGAALDQDPDGRLLGGGGPPFENGSYNPFLKKVGSCGRLVALAPDEDPDSPPALRRSASARRPPQPGSPTHSPTPTRSARHAAASSIKGRPPSRRGATPTSNSARRAPQSGGGFLDVHPSGSSETLDPDAYLLRNFQTTNKGTSFFRSRTRVKVA